MNQASFPNHKAAQQSLQSDYKHWVRLPDEGMVIGVVALANSLGFACSG